MVDPTSPKSGKTLDTDWTDASDFDELPQEILQSFPALDGPIEIRPLSGGLLNQSFHLRQGDVEYVLQRVNDVFSPEIHTNIRAVTTHLAARGVPCAPLLPTREGGFCTEHARLGRWRLMPHLGGTSFETIQSTAQAHSAGELVGRFHAALRDFDAPLAALGIPYRDTPRYLAGMRDALDRHPTHRLAEPMRPLGERIERTFETWGPPPELPQRVIHGDLKISNLLFEGPEPPERDLAFALIDLDTLMRAPLWIELGDAWRSWCNPARDAASGTGFGFDLDVFEASFAGFLEGHAEPLSRAEIDSLGMAPERITLELCSRFVADAVEETYWGWDSSRFPRRGEHNAARAFEQWQFYEAIQTTRTDREAIVRRLTS
jgi:Ser/Thr protein kinase RdoA (MazF antagonist)